MLNGCPVSGSVARITPATTVRAPEISLMPNLAASPPASSTSPQASHNGANSWVGSWTARNVARLKPPAKPMLCAASATANPKVAPVHRIR